MGFIRRSLLGVVLLSLTLGLIAVAGSTVFGALQERWSSEAPSRPARERVIVANVIAYSAEEITPELSAFGEVQSRRTLDLRASAGGSIVWLAEGFETGGSVEAGQILVRIDPQDAQSAFDLARADLNEAEADLRDAERSLDLARDELAASEDQSRLRQRSLDRQVDLRDRGVGTEAAVETAELNLASANQAVLARRQAIAQAEARIDQVSSSLERRSIALAEAERRLSDTEIKAEFSGVLDEVAVVAGGLVTANERIARIVDPESLEVAFRVSTSQYSRLLDENGQLRNAQVNVSLDVFGADLLATGQINREGAAVGDGQTGRLLFARLDAAPGFRPGDFVTASIREAPLQRVARLPSSAVDASGGILVVGDEDRLRLEQTEILRRQGDDVLVRARGLEGQWVVTERTPLLGVGIKIRPLEPRDPDAPAAEPAGPELIALEPERRARIVAFLEENQFMPAEVKERMLAQLRQDRVPVQVVERLESRMGG